MTDTCQRTPYTKALKPRNMLTKETLDELARREAELLEASRKQAVATRPTVQMSVRMWEEEYLRFRALCKALRKTNGDTLLHLMNAFEEANVDRSAIL